MRPVAVIELNELNFDYVQRYVDAGELPGFKALLANSALNLTTSEEHYSEWEPWIQWVTAHTGHTLAQHGIFRLGDVVDADIDQVWEKLERQGLRVGALSPMNASNGMRSPAFFLPDPWTQTPMVAPWALKRVYAAIARAVSQNADGRLDAATLAILMVGLVGFARPANYFQYLSLAASSLARPWLRAVFLDLFLSDIFVSLKRTTKPDFSSAFFNAGAHIQHHYMFSSAVYAGVRSNPEWYVKPGSDPILDVYKTYDRIMSTLLIEFPETRFMVATGLHQVPHESDTFYWRLKDHARFLSSAGVRYSEVRPLMSRDFVVSFSNVGEAEVAEQLFIDAMASNGDHLFSVDNRGTEIFLELVYAKDITPDLTWRFNSKVFSGVRDLVAFVAIKNGAHNGIGYFIDTGAAGSKPERFPLSQLVDKILVACGVQTTANARLSDQPVG